QGCLSPELGAGHQYCPACESSDVGCLHGARTSKEGGMITITLPWPDSKLMPNRRHGKHWASGQPAKVRSRQDAYYLAKAEKAAALPEGEIPLRIEFHAPDARKRDIDNLLAAHKAALDGIAQALGIDDSRFRPITLDYTQDTNKRGFVRIQIGEAA